MTFVPAAGSTAASVATRAVPRRTVLPWMEVTRARSCIEPLNPIRLVSIDGP